MARLLRGGGGKGWAIKKKVPMAIKLEGGFSGGTLSTEVNGYYWFMSVRANISPSPFYCFSYQTCISSHCHAFPLPTISSLYLFLNLSHSLPFFLSFLSVSPNFSFCVLLFLSVFACLSLFLSLLSSLSHLFIYVSLCFFLSLFDSLCLSVSLFVSLWISMSHSVSLCICPCLFSSIPLSIYI